MSLRSPLGRVLGLGAAKEGVGHWWAQRVSAVALVFLTLWFVAALLRVPLWSYEAFSGWIARPVNAGLLVLLAVALTYHSKLGVQVVLEDYVSHKFAKVVCLVVNQFLHLALATIAVLAILRIALGVAA